jgi:hypothetical protein
MLNVFGDFGQINLQYNTNKLIKIIKIIKCQIEKQKTFTTSDYKRTNLWVRTLNFNLIHVI